MLLSTLADNVKERLAEIKGQLERKGRGELIYPSVPTGIPSWDRNGGILRGILTVIGAATGEGKSIVKLQLARGAAQSGHHVLMLDFEDPKEKTSDRVFSTSSGINNRLLGLLDIDAFDVARLEAAAEEIGAWASRIEHQVGLLDAKTTRGVTAAFLEKHPAGCLVLVDYAQAFPEDDDTTMERTIARFAWWANATAQKYNCAFVVFSQIVRDVEARGYRVFERARFKNPDAFDVSGFCPGGLSDISWAKSLGERAKDLAYIWRENRIARKLGANVKDNRMRIIYGKCNFGEERDILLDFDGPTASIRDIRR